MSTKKLKIKKFLDVQKIFWMSNYRHWKGGFSIMGVWWKPLRFFILAHVQIIFGRFRTIFSRFWTVVGGARVVSGAQI